MLGTTQLIGSSMLSQDDPNFKKENKEKSYLFVTADQFNTALKESRVKISGTELDGIFFSDWKIPNILYSPENIFANKIPAFDINFVNPHKYEAIELDEDGDGTKSSSNKVEQTPAEKIAPTIASWYKGFRNIAIVGLLSVLVYLGIRILLGSTAPEKAKYKQRLVDWLVALCLVFVIHIIMSGILMITEKITNLFSQESSDVIVAVAEDPEAVNSAADIEKNTIGDSYGFRTNLTGYVRFMAQSSEFGDSAIYTILYVALIIYTVMFTFTYFKRFLYMAFFTMIAPLVALTYPLDKVRDGNAQAFNLWFKEYTMNAILQPVHLILYTVLISSAMSLAVDNPIYAIVAIAFLLPAEKFIKKMFGLDRAESTSALGAFAGGALTMKGVGAVAGMFKGNGKKAQENSGVLDKASTGLKTAGAVTKNPLLSIAGGAVDLIDKGKDVAVKTAKGVAKTAVAAGSTALASVAGDDGMGVEYGDQNTNNVGVNNQKEGSENHKDKDKDKNNDNDNGEKETKNVSNISRIKRGLKDVAEVKRRKIKSTFSRKNIGKNLKYVAKAGTKLVGAGLGATALGTVATAAAMTTGDMGNAASMLAGGVATGAGLGGSMAGKVADAVEKKVSESNTISTFKSSYNYDRLETIKKKEREREFKEFKESAENYQFLINKGFNGEQAKEFLEKELQDYYDVGIRDLNLVVKAEEKLKKKGYSKERRVHAAGIANQLPKDFKKNYDEQNKFMKNAKKTTTLTKHQIMELNNDMKELLD